MKGFVFAGYVCNPQINNGEAIPLYDIADPPAGRASINTVEGWNAMVEREEALRHGCMETRRGQRYPVRPSA